MGIPADTTATRGQPISAETTGSAGHGDRKARLYAAPDRDRSLPWVVLACSAVLALGYRVREELLIRPDEGLGYALGIIGLACMTLLLSYSLRKRADWMHGIAPLRRWFQTHMALGLIGPSAILLHANFELGSMNARIALASMALVVGSGIVGRVLYARVHRGLFGRRREFEPLLVETREGFGPVAAMANLIPSIEAELVEFQRRATEPPLRFTSGIARFLTIGVSRSKLTRRAVAALREAKPVHREALESELIEWLDRAAELARFRGYERLLSIWHAVHLPLCILLFGAAAAHVLAVHMY
jgi:hypothetical protein